MDGQKSTPPLLAPEDYYFEGECMVFTAAYHLKRGYCCGSGCRHCPYDHANVPRELPDRPRDVTDATSAENAP